MVIYNNKCMHMASRMPCFEHDSEAKACQGGGRLDHVMRLHQHQHQHQKLYLDLLGELASGRHNDSIWAVRGHLLRHERLLHYVDQHGQHESGRLSRTSLGYSNDIALLQADGDGRPLDR